MKDTETNIKIEDDTEQNTNIENRLTAVEQSSEVTAEAVVTKQGFNTLASFQMALQFGDKEVKCGDQNNNELHGKPLINKALCLPQTIGSTTGSSALAASIA